MIRETIGEHRTCPMDWRDDGKSGGFFGKIPGEGLERGLPVGLCHVRAPAGWSGVFPNSCTIPCRFLPGVRHGIPCDTSQSGRDCPGLYGRRTLMRSVEELMVFSNLWSYNPRFSPLSGLMIFGIHQNPDNEKGDICRPSQLMTLSTLKYIIMQSHWSHR
jgi:hypothetical protein